MRITNQYTNLVLILVIILCMVGCTPPPEEVTPEVPPPVETNPPSVEIDTSDDEIQTADELPYSFPENPVVFDFAVLPEDVFPRGSWTVNQLVNKYGIPAEVFAYYSHRYYGATDIVFVNVQYEDYKILFNIELAERFSFYKESIEDGSYDLSDSDKNMEQEILDLQFESENISFPNEIKIRQTTKSQVLEAYPAGSAYSYKDSWVSDSGEEYSIDELAYYYGFRNEEGLLPVWTNPPWNPGYEIGTITYSFDENELLTNVLVRWWFFDI